MSYPVNSRFNGIFYCSFWHISVYSVLNNGFLTVSLTVFNGCRYGGN
nr:MAG TPA: hypothetical protein [Caudoviricetes sp.]